MVYGFGLAALATLLIILYIQRRNETGNLLPSQRTEVIADANVLRMIEDAECAHELMDVLGYDGEDEDNDLVGEENRVFLEKAKRFENKLDEDDWYRIYQAAEEGSELEHYAEQRIDFD